MKRALAGGFLMLLAGSCGSDARTDADSDPAGEPLAATIAGNTNPDLAVTCEVAAHPRLLSEEVRETSGLAQGRRGPDVLWTHNDAGGEPYLYALDAEGAPLGKVRVTGAELVDWEDIEAAPCAGGECLYVGDIGDNDGRRDFITVYEVPEPSPGDASTAPAVRLPARYPDGRWDAEALFVMPDGGLYIVTKGRRGAISLYRYPEPRRPDTLVVLEPVRQLAAAPSDPADRVTAATTTREGGWVAIRTYRALHFFRGAELVGGVPVEPLTLDLRGLGHPQGESVAIGADGSVWLSSEAEGGGLPLLSRLQCSFPGGPP